MPCSEPDACDGREISQQTGSDTCTVHGKFLSFVLGYGACTLIFCIKYYGACTRVSARAFRTCVTAPRSHISLASSELLPLP